MLFKVANLKICFSDVQGVRAKVSISGDPKISISCFWSAIQDPKKINFFFSDVQGGRAKFSIYFRRCSQVSQSNYKSSLKDQPHTKTTHRSDKVSLCRLLKKFNNYFFMLVDNDPKSQNNYLFLCLWIMTKIQKALDTFLPHSVSGFFYPWCFFCLWCCSTFWPFYIPPRLWTSPRWTAWLMWISKKRATFSKYL